MTRYSTFVLVLLCACAGGCASRGSVADLGERMVFLEREVLATRTDQTSLRDEAHELDLRVEYLEREALKRGVAVAPRRSGTSPAPAESAAAAPRTENAVPRPAPAKPPVQTAKPSPAPARSARSETPASSRQPDTSSTPQSESDPTVPGSAVSSSSATAAPAAPSTDIPSASLPRLTESTPATPAPPAAPSRVPVQPEQKAYDAALHLYRTGRYPESEAAFQAFLEVYPNSRLVPNALYWKGETYYSRGRYTDAIFAFKDVQTRFPRDLKTPDSLLKTAMAYQKLGDTANASLHLTVLYEDWPGAEAAQRARRMGLKP